MSLYIIRKRIFVFFLLKQDFYFFYVKAILFYFCSGVLSLGYGLYNLKNNRGIWFA